MNGLFGINGLSGYFLSVALLLVIVFVLGYLAITTQKNQVNNPYIIENPSALEKKSMDNAKHYKIQ
ncbi:DUF4006 family protein [Helicobacter apodemus]|uniref:DUF4006 family protein n=1 Tax=Helicobacter apodemus TaxID=135569 RepID=A0A099UH46_9HELI|nr:DUF4006 family protein [Helicobacter apodemus]AWI34672.1 hypothetical protein CDV25_07770 [Helicobacter apodemus]TLE15852.1 DUF4006 family protein [Helicobacter apodemus]